MHPSLDPTIQTIQVREDGLVATFYKPGTPPPWRAGRAAASISRVPASTCRR